MFKKPYLLICFVLVSLIFVVPAEAYINAFYATPAPSYDQTPTGAAMGAYSQVMQMQSMEMQLAMARQAEQNAENNQVLLLFSQNKKPVFLGCLTCAKNSPYAIANKNSRFGNPKSKLSILNRNGAYGSLRSNFSPCDSKASLPPVIVNKNGAKLALLTLNSRLFGAETNPNVQHSLKTHVCGLKG